LPVKKEITVTKRSTRTLLFLAAGACILLAATVTTDYDHSANFSRYKTYSWIKIQAPDSIWEDRLRHAVDSELVAKGWSQVPAGSDAGLTAFFSEHKQPRLETFYSSFGGGWRWRGFGGDGFATTTVEATPVGTLVLHIFDSQTKKLIWRGVASDVLSDKAEKDTKKLEKAVKEMFKHFPPQS
jgi:Domain of unknown function (DUF4136)